jgi:hypothetical protein
VRWPLGGPVAGRVGSSDRLDRNCARLPRGRVPLALRTASNRTLASSLPGCCPAGIVPDRLPRSDAAFGGQVFRLVPRSPFFHNNPKIPIPHPPLIINPHPSPHPPLTLLPSLNFSIPSLPNPPPYPPPFSQHPPPNLFHTHSPLTPYHFINYPPPTLHPQNPPPPPHPQPPHNTHNPTTPTPPPTPTQKYPTTNPHK